MDVDGEDASSIAVPSHCHSQVAGDGGWKDSEDQQMDRGAYSCAGGWDKRMAMWMAGSHRIITLIIGMKVNVLRDFEVWFDIFRALTTMDSSFFGFHISSKSPQPWICSTGLP